MSLHHNHRCHNHRARDTTASAAGRRRQITFYITSSKSFLDQCPFIRQVESPLGVESRPPLGVCDTLARKSHNCPFWKASTRLREVVNRAVKSSAADLCKAQVKRLSLSLLSLTRPWIAWPIGLPTRLPSLCACDPFTMVVWAGPNNNV
jgi:hypothetical protein